VPSRLLVAQVRPGAVLHVHYGPKSPQRLTVDTQALAAAPTPSAPAHAPERLAELEELRRQGLVSEEEYERKRHKTIDQL